MSFNWVNQLRIDAGELAAYTREVEARLAKAERELLNISAGLVDNDTLSYSWPQDTQIRVSAARAIERINKMPKRNKPWSSYF